ncbi:hypothetical protein AALO_G00091250 [Alosa alosa]|nr:hypothetical protein AALO_G00091250 [Alosa alosa]
MSSSEEEDHGCEPVGPMQQKRSHSPVPSCVSMKSDWSLEHPLNFAGGGVPAGQSSIQQKGSSSPVPSSVSMKTDRSMGEPLHFEEGVIPADQRYQQIHKSHLQKKFQSLIEGITQQEEIRLLQEIYTELYITEGG